MAGTACNLHVCTLIRDPPRHLATHARAGRRMTQVSPAETLRVPLVSILVPSFNGAKFLREALDSILAQSYPRIEVLLLDDASTDDTEAIAASYAGRISYVRQPSNLGQFGNVNVGISLARGEFIAVYHADDFYLPTIVQEEVAYLQRHPEVGAVFCADIFVDANGREYGRMRLPAEVSGERPLDFAVILNALLSNKNRFLVGPSAMVRREAYHRAGAYDLVLYGIAADLEMWLRIAKNSPLAVLESHLMCYRHFHGNLSQVYDRLRTVPENFFAIMDAYLDAGGRAIATDAALADYEAHRAEDVLMRAISSYIKAEIPQGRRILRDVRIAAILASTKVQRWRLLILLLGLRCLLHLPRIEFVATLMFERWHVKRPPRQPRRYTSLQLTVTQQKS